MAQWLACWTPDRVVWIRVLTSAIVLYSWARHFTLTVPLFTQEYKWLPANCWGNLTECWGVTCDELASHPGRGGGGGGEGRGDTCSHLKAGLSKLPVYC